MIIPVPFFMASDIKKCYIENVSDISSFLRVLNYIERRM